MKFKSVDEILDFAIQKEQDAADFYTSLAEKMAREHMKKIFLEFAGEEMRHKAKLEAAKSGNILLSSEKQILDLGIGDHLSEVDADDELDKMNYQTALIIAMKAEKAAYKLYNDLAEAAQDSQVRELFKNLAQEEAKHKLRFEIEYDDAILTEN
ncbi:MAG: ferritin family protein [bacterium]